MFARTSCPRSDAVWGPFYLFVAVSAVALFANSLQAETTNSPSLSLDEVLREVLSKNSSLKAARAHWEAMKQRIPQARAWEDARVGVDVERTGKTQFFSYTDTEWMAAQELPLTGKNRKRGKAATAEAVAAFEELHRRELDLQFKARAAYYRLSNAYEQLDVSQRSEALLKQFVEITRARYEVGRAPQADVLVAESDLARLLEARVDILQQLAERESELNVLMNRRAQEPVARPASLLFMPLNFDSRYLERTALEKRPEVVAATQRAAAERARWELAKRQWIPDPEIRVEARQYNGQGAAFQEYDTGIFFNFPWANYSKQRAAIEEAKSNLESAEHELEAERNQTLGRVRDQLKRIGTFHHHTGLFQERLLPLAEAAIKAQQNAYEADKTGFLELSMAQRNLQEAQSMYWHHLTEYLSAVAELEAIVGAEVKGE